MGQIRRYPVGIVGVDVGVADGGDSGGSECHSHFTAGVNIVTGPAAARRDRGDVLSASSTSSTAVPRGSSHHRPPNNSDVETAPRAAVWPSAAVGHDRRADHAAAPHAAAAVTHDP